MTKFALPAEWGAPNGSLKSFVYKLVYNAGFRSDILCLFAGFALWGGFCAWAVRPLG